MPDPRLVHIGTYADSGGVGVVPLAIAADGTLRAGEPWRAARNASFAARAAGTGLSYWVDERAGMVSVQRRDAERWHELARVPSGGSGPCYLALDDNERTLAVANYDSGHVALFALDQDGRPKLPPALFHAPGQGPVTDRQDGPHAHCVRFSPDRSALYAVDLGADRIMRLELQAGRLGPAELAFRAPPGSAPRHLLFIPDRPLAVLLSELSSTLTLLEWKADGTLAPIEVVSTLPPDFKGENLGGHLELDPSGKRVYVSNRGHNSIAVFQLEAADRSASRLVPLCHVASGGDHPRHFRLYDKAGPGALLLVAHEQDGRVSGFRLAPDGRPEPWGDGIVIAGACCVLA